MTMIHIAFGWIKFVFWSVCLFWLFFNLQEYGWWLAVLRCFFVFASCQDGEPVSKAADEFVKEGNQLLEDKKALSEQHKVSRYSWTVRVPATSYVRPPLLGYISLKCLFFLIYILVYYTRILKTCFHGVKNNIYIYIYCRQSGDSWDEVICL